MPDIENLLARQVRSLLRGVTARFDPSSDESMVDWAESIGTNLRGVPDVLEIYLYCLRKFRAKESIRVVIEGPRGGGKTQLVATLEDLAYLFFGWSWVNMGASKEQAFRCYKHLRDFHKASTELQTYTETQQVTFTRAHNGAEIQVLAATETSFRGAHPTGNREGFDGGGCTLDEAAIIPNDVIDDSKGVLTASDPSALIQISTMGKALSGRFYALSKNPEKQNYRGFKYNLFGVAKRCHYECSACPVKEFANEFTPPGAKTPHAPLCGGKAHETSGWVSIDEIIQHWTELPYSVFMREYMGEATRLAGQIYRGDLLDKLMKSAIRLSRDKDQERNRFLALDKSTGVDWGFAGQTAIVDVVRVRLSAIPYRWSFFTEETFDNIRAGNRRAVLSRPHQRSACRQLSPVRERGATQGSPRSLGGGGREGR